MRFSGRRSPRPPDHPHGPRRVPPEVPNRGSDRVAAGRRDRVRQWRCGDDGERSPFPDAAGDKAVAWVGNRDAVVVRDKPWQWALSAYACPVPKNRWIQDRQNLLSLFNMGGRFFWASISDLIGRKNTYFCFFVIGTVLLVLPWLLAAMWACRPAPSWPSATGGCAASRRTPWPRWRRGRRRPCRRWSAAPCPGPCGGILHRPG